MRIRIKRAGWLLFGGLFVAFCCTMAVVAFRAFYLKKDVSLPSFAAEGVSATTKVTVSASSTDSNLQKAAGPVLKNAGFEDGFGPVTVQANQAAKLSGNIPTGWFDLSQWSDLEAKYEECHDRPHSGKTCAKIQIGDLKTRSILFAQPLIAKKGRKYKTGIWMRADSPTPINVGVRMRGKPYFYYGQAGVIVGQQWQHYEFETTVRDVRYPFVLFLVEDFTAHSTLYLDDAEFEDDGVAPPLPPRPSPSPGTPPGASPAPAGQPPAGH